LRFFKTKSVDLDGDQTLYIAWDETYCETAASLEEAESKLAAHSIPPGFTARYSRGMIDAEDSWVVTRPEYPGLVGVGGSPEEAVENFEAEKLRRWHPKRFKTLVKSIHRVIGNSEDEDRDEIKAEFGRFIQDIRARTFKYEG
jgi:hypothetical protein